MLLEQIKPQWPRVHARSTTYKGPEVMTLSDTSTLKQSNATTFNITSSQEMRSPPQKSNEITLQGYIPHKHAKTPTNAYTTSIIQITSLLQSFIFTSNFIVIIWYLDIHQVNIQLKYHKFGYIVTFHKISIHHYKSK